MNDTAKIPAPSGSLPATDAGFERLKSVLSPGAMIRRNEPLAARTTLRVGGPADVYVEPAGEAELGAVLAICAERDWPVLVLGRGSNLLVKDGGFRGVVICLGHESFRRIEANGLRLRCGAGARVKAIAAEARRRGVGGLEFFEGIPGTLGGALRMNAGAMGASTFERVETVRLMDRAGAVEERPAAALGATYRHCEGLREFVALGAVLLGAPGSPEEIERTMAQFSQKRRASQPAAASAGCMFKNPAGIPAGRLIDELGLKGARVGAARVSLEHGNFLVNDGGATAREVLGLIELVRRRAWEARGIELETEVRIVGE